MTDDAWVRLDERNGRLTAVLTPRVGSGVGLVARWRREYESAATRCLFLAEQRVLNAAVMSRALELAQHVDARRQRPLPELSPERRAEISALLAEADAAPKDPLGITRPWSDRGSRD